MTESLFGDESPDCPQCGAEKPLPILYGTPSAEMITAAKLGQIALGGDAVSDRCHEWECQDPTCKYQF